MNKAAWASFWILGCIWGSSFLLIRIGVEDIPATQLVMVRIVIAAIGLNLVRMWRKKALPTDGPSVRAFILLGAGNTAIPYTLISLAEQNISSGMAAVLQATAAFFTLIIAHFAFSDERISPQKLLGLAVGFSGVVVLSSRAIETGEVNTAMLLGILGMVSASLFYGIFTVYSRTVIKRNMAPVVIASGTFLAGTVWSLLFMLLEPILGGRGYVPFQNLPSNAVLAVLGLGFVNTFIAYLFFYFIVQQLGAFRASMVTYIVPAVGLLLGLIIGEEVTLVMVLGALLIFAGIAIINLRFEQIRQYLAARATA